jgi:hypothetical protein
LFFGSLNQETLPKFRENFRRFTANGHETPRSFAELDPKKCAYPNMEREEGEDNIGLNPATKY